MPTAPHPPLTKRLSPGHWTVLDALAGALLAYVAWRGTLDTYRVFDPHHRGYPRPSAAMFVVALAATVVVGLSVALRRRFPLSVCAAVFASWTAVVAVLGQTSMARVVGTQIVAASALLLYLVAATRNRRTALLALGAGLAGVAAARFGSGELRHNIPVALAAQTTFWAVGYAVGRHRAYAAELRAYQARDALTERTRERLRLARELHDVIAHSMSVVTVQAGYGHFVIDEHPQEAKAALTTIQAVGRDTLRELSGLLSVLREGGTDDCLPVLPAPGLGELGRLITRTAEAGVKADLRVHGRRRELSPGIELSAYRIVQEALTNVVKHAGTGECRVTVGYQVSELTVEVVDGGAGAAAPSRDGQGLAGMRERVGLYGGEFSAGPLPGRGFRVAARLPMAGAEGNA
ncbi:histidine kinase [Streptomyces sp. NPDC051020]|uniref:sensor histidine kinase n=1 Tax=Streptomyces sp. NPDC051020 TaxID=3155409 RepID=UPI003431C941